MERVLVVAFGNPLRCDDGIAWQAAEELRRTLPFADIVCVHQLTPELAERASRADLVVFLDAAANGIPGKVSCQAVSSEPAEVHFSHHLAPGEILALCDRLYATKPRGFLISVHGECFDHGQELSPAAVKAIPQVVAKVSEAVRRLSDVAGNGVIAITDRANQFI
jgi:hydrogenase maturation protease